MTISQELDRVQRIDAISERAVAAHHLMESLTVAITEAAAVRREAIVALRNRGMTLAQLGALLGIDQSRVSRIVSNGAPR